MLNWVFMGLVVIAAIAAAHLGTMNAVTAATANSAKTAVEIAIGLIGQMALWLGLMKIVEDAGLLKSLSRAMAPLMKRLFPEVPAEHPAMAAMILNIAANMLGLGNAATPFGLRAMYELNKLNQRRGVATNAMCLFLAINTAGVQMLPLNVIGVRATLGAKNLTGIVLPTLCATIFSALMAIVMTKLLQNRALFSPARYPESTDDVKLVEVKGMNEAEAKAEIAPPPASPLHLIVILAIAIAIGSGFMRQLASETTFFTLLKDVMESWLLPLVIIAILMLGFARRVKVYESVVTGAKEGFQIAVAIIPFMVAILVAIGMFRASGAMDLMVAAIAPLTNLFGFPPEALPMALIRPLSSSAGLAVMTETMKVHGPDSFVGFLVSVISGSVETTFYVLALYFGSIGIRATRHTVIACLSADLVGVAGALVFSRLFY
jgi:spore maturation protein SpmA